MPITLKTPQVYSLNGTPTETIDTAACISVTTDFLANRAEYVFATGYFLQDGSFNIGVNGQRLSLFVDLNTGEFSGPAAGVLDVGTFNSLSTNSFATKDAVESAASATAVPVDALQGTAVATSVPVLSPPIKINPLNLGVQQ